LKTTYFEVNNDKKKILPLDRYVSKTFRSRKNKGKRHPLTSILALVVIGLMCGHKGWTSIAIWARSQPALAKALGFTKKITPCAATIHNLLKKLDVEALEETLRI
ncbi:transposase family protein, partial [Candidatus Poribacteria bacterium]|nr:transposase family protein [Candidatus Poribacteria bacterium]